MKLNSSALRRWSRTLHRDLSYLFAGMVLIYALSGIAMNHRDTFNPNYSVSQTRLTLPAPLPEREAFSRDVYKRQGCSTGRSRFCITL